MSGTGEMNGTHVLTYNKISVIFKHRTMCDCRWGEPSMSSVVPLRQLTQSEVVLVNISVYKNHDFLHEHEDNSSQTIQQPNIVISCCVNSLVLTDTSIVWLNSRFTKHVFHEYETTITTKYSPLIFIHAVVFSPRCCSISHLHCSYPRYPATWPIVGALTAELQGGVILPSIAEINKYYTKYIEYPKQTMHLSPVKQLV